MRSREQIVDGLVTALDATSLPSDEGFLSPDEVDEMSSLELLYEFCKEGGAEVIGDPNTAFAAFDARTGVLSVYQTDAQFVSQKSVLNSVGAAGLKYALDAKASFVCNENWVVCVMADVVAYGATYEEAALRAVLKVERVNRELRKHAAPSSGQA